MQDPTARKWQGLNKNFLVLLLGTLIATPGLDTQILQRLMSGNWPGEGLLPITILLIFGIHFIPTLCRCVLVL